MSVAYRDSALACPGCAEPLAPTAAGEAIVDVCPGCAGVWVDWDDGELTYMVKGVPESLPPARPATGGTSTCPRCRAPLIGERYGTSEAEILRCAGCIGAFVPRSSIALLVVGAAPTSKPEEPKGFFDKLINLLRALTI